MLERGRAAGLEVRGIADHDFIHSIYFRDPNGYVIELTAKMPSHAATTDPTQSRARELLNQWQARKV
jgi:catechol-2,3-dioxygenase